MKPAPGEQHQRQRQLDDDERAGPASGAHAAAAAAAAVLQDLVQVRLRRVQRRCEPEHDAGAETDRGEEREDARVHRELDPVRFPDVGRREVEQLDRRPPPAPARSSPPISESSTLSTSSCRTMRQRVAPSDTRTDISRARAAERASIRFATLAQAISSTKPTAPISARKTSWIGPPL